jgi:mRNA-degrading endonuclease RelE of RelBE toxin-antitoxin system
MSVFKTKLEAAIYYKRVKTLDTPPKIEKIAFMATVHLTAEAERQFDRLPVTIKERFHKLFRRLEAWPEVSGSKPLRGELAGFHRMHTGDYRLRF